MKPFLFPFTYLSASDLATCGQFFKGIKVFHFSEKTIPPEMQTLFDTGRMESVMPDPHMGLSFETALAQTESWAQSHRLGAASYAKGYTDRIPFFDASSVSQIRQDIRKADQQDQAADTDAHETMAACIFLHMAQSFDVQNQTIVQQMQQQASMEKTLYEELRGDAPLEHMDRSENFDDPVQYMLLDRLKAWSQVWTTTNIAQDLFITTRQTVIALIQEQVSEKQDFIPVATVPAIKSGSESRNDPHQDLGEFCRNLATSDMARIRESGLLEIFPPSSEPSDGMQIYVLPGIIPNQFFGYWADHTEAIETDKPSGDNIINTVIGLIEAHSA
jgi:hypothetical protein